MKKNRLTASKRYLCKKRLGPNEKIHTSTKNCPKRGEGIPEKALFLFVNTQNFPSPPTRNLGNFFHFYKGVKVKKCQNQIRGFSLLKSF